MYKDLKTPKDRLTPTIRAKGIMAKRPKTKALDKMKGTNKAVDIFNAKKEAAERADQ